MAKYFLQYNQMFIITDTHILLLEQLHLHFYIICMNMFYGEKIFTTQAHTEFIQELQLEMRKTFILEIMCVLLWIAVSGLNKIPGLYLETMFWWDRV